MGTKRISPKRAPRSGHELLRNRAVLHDGQMRDLLFERSQGKRPRDLRHVPRHLFDATPTLKRQMVEGNFFRPRVKTGSRSDASTLRGRLDAMHRNAGELVLVTSIRHDLAGMPLKHEATVAAWKDGHEFMLDIISPDALAFDAVLQAGGITGQFHDHTVLPLGAILPDLRTFALDMPRGAGGGAVHEASGLHLVVMGDEPEDRARVASYMSRDSDGRFDLPDDHSDYLQAHEDALVRKLTGVKSPKLTRQRLPDAWR